MHGPGSLNSSYFMRCVTGLTPSIGSGVNRIGRGGGARMMDSQAHSLSRPYQWARGWIGVSITVDPPPRLVHGVEPVRDLLHVLLLRLEDLVALAVALLDDQVAAVRAGGGVQRGVNVVAAVGPQHEPGEGHVVVERLHVLSSPMASNPRCTARMISAEIWSRRRLPTSSRAAVTSGCSGVLIVSQQPVGMWTALYHQE